MGVQHVTSLKIGPKFQPATPRSSVGSLGCAAHSPTSHFPRGDSGAAEMASAARAAPSIRLQRTRLPTPSQTARRCLCRAVWRAPRESLPTASVVVVACESTGRPHGSTVHVHGVLLRSILPERTILAARLPRGPCAHIPHRETSPTAVVATYRCARTRFQLHEAAVAWVPHAKRTPRLLGKLHRHGISWQWSAPCATPIASATGRSLVGCHPLPCANPGCRGRTARARRTRPLLIHSPTPKRAFFRPGYPFHSSARGRF